MGLRLRKPQITRRYVCQFDCTHRDGDEQLALNQRQRRFHKLLSLVVNRVILINKNQCRHLVLSPQIRNVKQNRTLNDP